VDPRIAKTRQRLQDALFELARERSIDEVSVGDIAQHAGVNRTTFYLHYSDKETLLADALDLVAQRAGATLADIDVVSPQPPSALSDFLAHVDEHADLYGRIFTEPGYGVVLARLRKHMETAIERLASDTGRVTRPDAPLALVSAGVAGAILGMMAAWLESDPRAKPATAAQWIWELVPRPLAPS